MMRRFVIFILSIFIVAVSADVDAAKRRTASRQKSRGINTVKQEQRDTRKDIQQTAEQIEANRRNTVRSLNQLDALNADIQAHTRSIKRITMQIDSLNSRISHLSDSVQALDRRLTAMRESYARTVVKIHDKQRGSGDAIAFIFSAENFTQAYRRMRYLKEVSSWRERRSRELAAQADTLRAKKKQLASMQADKTNSLVALNDAANQLKSKQKQTADIVENLKKENTSLRQVLKDKESKARALDAELDRLIAEEQKRQEEEARKKEEARRQEEARQSKLAQQNQSKKSIDSSAKKSDKKADGKEAKTSAKTVPASKKDKETPRTYATAAETRSLAGSFESNKGRLLFPVAGRYKIIRPFGRQQHPNLKHVVTDNAGIDIEVSAGGTARAVFAGKVSAIFRQPGYNTIVMVRHGRYLTVYAGLSDISVHNGQELTQGQTIGKVFADPDDDGRAILHFELRREKEKLNPALWVK